MSSHGSFGDPDIPFGPEDDDPFTVSPSAAGAVFTGAATLIDNAIARNQARKFADEQRIKNQEFQAEQAGSVYQRGMTDMKKAGLNPILMASGGFGASSASGGLQSPVNMSLGAGAATSTAMASARFGLEMENLKQQNTLLRYKSTTEQSVASLNSARNYNVSAAFPRSDFERDFYSTKYGKRLLAVDANMKALGGITGAASSAASAKRLMR